MLAFVISSSFSISAYVIVAINILEISFDLDKYK